MILDEDFNLYVIYKYLHGTVCVRACMCVLDRHKQSLQRRPYANPWNLWVRYFTSARASAGVIKLKTLRRGDYPGLSAGLDLITRA